MICACRENDLCVRGEDLVVQTSIASENELSVLAFRKFTNHCQNVDTARAWARGTAPSSAFGTSRC